MIKALTFPFFLAGLTAAIAQPQPTEHHIVPLPPGAFARYAGWYQVAPKAVAQASEEDGHFYLQITHQPRIEMFPEGKDQFYIIQPPVSFTFQGGTPSAALVVHQAGRDITAPRISEYEAKAIAAIPVGHPMPRTWPMMAGIHPRALTSLTSGFDYWPIFSPDGKWVVFSRSTNARDWQLYRVPATGGAAEPLSKSALPVAGTRANWSASQNLIAFAGETPGGGSAIWTIRPDGTPAQVLPGSDHLTYPTWYPDGTHLAAMSDQFTIVAIDGTGANRKTLTDRSQVFTGMPSVSPDGKSIVFAGQKNAGQPYDQNENTIWIWDGSAPHPVETPPLQGRAPSWSPDGKRIAFESDRGSPDGHYAIFVVNRDGTGLTQVTDYALFANHPIWSQDGKHMVFSQGVPGQGANGISIVDLPD